MGQNDKTFIRLGYRDKHSSLLLKGVNYREKSFMASAFEILNEILFFLLYKYLAIIKFVTFLILLFFHLTLLILILFCFLFCL
jgi:hypothetical protein